MPKRNDDMHEPGFGVLSVTQDADVDMILSLTGKDLFTERLSTIFVEFCTGCGGGGRSPNVHAALLQLVDAINSDNSRFPSHTA